MELCRGWSLQRLSIKVDWGCWDCEPDANTYTSGYSGYSYSCLASNTIYGSSNSVGIHNVSHHTNSVEQLLATGRYRVDNDTVKPVHLLVTE